MKKFYTLIFISVTTLLHAADTPPDPTSEEYHRSIAAFVAFLAEKHPTAVSAQLQAAPDATQGRTTAKFTLQRKNGATIEACLQALRGFDWEHGKREDAPEGSKLAGRHAQFLALANEAAGVTRQSVDDQGDLDTTLTHPVSVERLKALFSQVPGLTGLIAQQGHGRILMLNWDSQDVTETHAN